MPFFIEMSNKRILIIGGGDEGFRRAEKYCKTGAEIIVYSKSFDDGLMKLSSDNRVKLVVGDVEDEERLERLIEDVDIVMVALDEKNYNYKIEKLARRHRRLLNLANDAEETEVVVPIDSKIGSIRIALTTEGKSSMVAREALDKITKFLEGERELLDLAEIMYKVKRIVRKNIPDYKKRFEIYRKIFNNASLREALRSGDHRRAVEIYSKILMDEGLDPGEVKV
ncbi:MAG: bifunctional precorrin-2 dehydrogenase/sirohydrochlorin ferrochelatase [Candidatus Caldarchaeales archaeon]